MPGFMGLRGLNPSNPHDKQRRREEDKRREEERQPSLAAQRERRADEKVREILRDQQGDMSRYSGHVDESAAGASDCELICRRPIGEIMSSKVVTLSFDDDLLTVQGIFARVKFRHLPVVDEEREVIGIISDRDFLREVSPFFGTVNEQKRDQEIMTRKVGTIMTRRPICANLGISIMDAVRMMSGRKISCLPIVKEGGLRILGIVTWKDIVRAFCPRAFAGPNESNRLRSGVDLNPETSESARLRALSHHSNMIFQRVEGEEADKKED